ncbi:MAG: GNAT family N-acetyltransferase [Limibacillus sp.]|jgi:microcystin degradation protein MlrC/ribosomal protein S18 acetylase RimI-like enzyme
MPTIALFRFWYEGNSFSPLPAREADFRSREWFSGKAAADFYRGKALEPGGAITAAERHGDVEILFLDCLAAYPAGPIEAGLFPAYQDRLFEQLGSRAWDGVYASLHGASVCEDIEQPELCLLRALRQVIGETPLALSFDLHANLNPEIGRLAEIIVGYKTHPHIDMAETGEKAMSLLLRQIEGEIAAHSTILPADFLPTSFNMRTDDGPMAEMAELAARCAEDNGLLDVTVFGGFACADSPDSGAAISLCGEAGGAALSAMGQPLREAYRRLAPDFEQPLPAPGEVLGELLASATQRPVAVLEPSDNVFSGGAGDTPGLLRAVLAEKPTRPCVFAFFWDPELVEEAVRAGEGAEMDCRLGGRLSDSFGAPLELTVQVERLVQGTFRNRGPMEAGLEVDPGPSAILRSGQVRILVTSRIVPVNDPAYFEHFGLALEPTTLFFVKAKNHFRAAFTGLFERFVPVETPGPAPSDILSLPFERVPRARLLFGRAPHVSKREPRLREARAEDAEAIAALHAESWRSTYRGILSDDYLEGEIHEERARFWRDFLARRHPGDLVILAEGDEGLLGFIALVDEDPDYDALIENLHVEPEQRGSGLGRKLLAEACRRLIAQGKNSVCLWVFDDNAAAFAFYLRLGGKVDKKTSDPDAPPSEADSRIGWHDLPALLAACEAKRGKGTA